MKKKQKHYILTERDIRQVGQIVHDWFTVLERNYECDPFGNISKQDEEYGRRLRRKTTALVNVRRGFMLVALE